MTDSKQQDKQDKKEQVVQETVEEQLENIAEDKDVEKYKKEAENYKNSYLRTLADYQNLERRVRDERIEMTKIAQARIIEELLPFLDTLNQAEIFIKDQGLKMVKNSFMQRLSEMGVKEVPLEGKEFDPHFAEAIDIVEGDEDNKVVEVLRKAYEFNGKLLRVGQVKVSKKKQ
jgi:molecular chaperone GrpE